MKNNRLFFCIMIFAIIIVCFTDCRNISKSAIIPSKEQQILIGQKIELSDTYSAIDLKIIDSMLIFLCYGDQYKFHVYNKNTLKLIGKFGQEGRAPSEYKAPLIMAQKIWIRDSAYIITYDLVLKRINFVNIIKAINNRNYSPKSINSRDRMISRLNIVTSAVFSEDSLIIGSVSDSRYNEGRFFCYNIRNDNIRWEPFYPVPKIAPHETRKSSIYESYLALRPDGKNIASAALYFERIDILDSHGKFQRHVIIENQDIQDFSIPENSAPQKGAHSYFTSVSVSQDFIYALDIDHVNGDPKIIDTVTLVRTTWEEKGLQPEIFKITPLTTKIAVDEENNKIFGIRSISSTLYVYNLGRN